jgi:hypothetical protein
MSYMLCLAKLDSSAIPRQLFYLRLTQVRILISQSSLNAHILSSVHVLQCADHIIALSSDGGISEQESFPELRFNMRDT